MPHASSHTVAPLPAWFYRLQAITDSEDCEIEPKDFDEDLSDFEAEEDDRLSESEYNGSDAAEYYDLRDQRDNRKAQLREYQKVKIATMESDRQKELEVQQAMEQLEEALEQGRQPPEISLVDKSWRLYSAEYVDHCFDASPDHFELPCLEFSSLKHYTFYDPAIHRPDDVSGNLRLQPDVDCCFGAFSSPKRASLEGKILEGKHPGLRQGYNIEFQLISNEYVIVKIPRAFVFLNHKGPPPPSAPATFTFMGKRE